ncbi:hypothetical protein LOAG_05346 [Loa loa]|uniref:Uncharacterized protein n=1 Tax=Loa loa TaxID=7209 RepID=A0A1S0TZZ3_LOALO|nr:hypothetical protein LOAG_05346 [Loa loa]EFO23140.1 hypothetical protein LOAG_05346 [Loa loa]
MDVTHNDCAPLLPLRGHLEIEGMQQHSKGRFFNTVSTAILLYLYNLLWTNYQQNIYVPPAHNVVLLNIYDSHQRHNECYDAKHTVTRSKATMIRMKSYG